MQLQLHYTNYTTPQLQLHSTTTTAALHHTTSSSCGWGDRPGDHCNHCSHSKKHSSNHLSVHQWIRFAIRDSQQPISPIRFLFLKLPPPPCAVLLVSICGKRKVEPVPADAMTFPPTPCPSSERHGGSGCRVARSVPVKLESYPTDIPQKWLFFHQDIQQFHFWDPLKNPNEEIHQPKYAHEGTTPPRDA